MNAARTWNSAQERLKPEARPARFRASLACALAIAIIHPAASVRAQDVTFTAGAGSGQVALGEQFQISFTLSGGNLRQYKDFRTPDFNANFLTLMGPSTSTQMQIINGKVSSSITWTFVLQPRAVGSYTIPPASVNYDGQILKSNPVPMKVTAGGPPTQKGQKKEEDPGANVNLGDNLFIRAICDARTVFVGQPVTVTYKLYARVAFQLDNPIKLPRMVGFWSEDLEAPSQLRPTVEAYDGKQYETFVLRKVVYFPTQAGQLSIDPFEINCSVQIRQKRRTGDDFFDRFFNDPFFDAYKSIKKTLSTEKIEITAKPLPETGKPALFKGAVGNYTMHAGLDRTALKTNETATLTLTIRGDGNIKLLEPPEISFPAGIDRYDPKVTDDVVKNGGKISGTKTLEYLLIPRFAGTLTIPPVEFSFFDLDTKSYRTLRSEPFVLDVKESGEKTPGGTAAPVEYIARDIRGLKQIGDGAEAPAGPGAPFLFLLYGLPAVAAIGGLLVKRRYDRLHGDVAGLKMRRANRMADRHLARSRKYIEANEIELYYQEIARALWGYIQHKLNLPTSELNTARIAGELSRRGIAEESVARFVAAVDQTDFARYSPSRAFTGEMRNLYAVAKSAIIDVEQGLST